MRDVLNMPALRRGLVLAAILLACTGCAAGSSGTAAGSVAASQVAPTSSYNAEYALGTGDKVRITVFGEESLTGEFEVASSGMIEMPLVGPVKASGLSTKTLTENLSGALKSGGYLRDPKVSAEILSYRPFFIMGEVTKPGEYPYRNGMNIMSAVATAGGFTYRANSRTVQIQRANEITPRDYPAATSINILPGDVVTIKERYF